jgi:hypothetical protein
LEIVAAGAKPLPDLLDTLKAIPSVGGRVLLIVLLAKVSEMPLEDGVKLITTTGNVSFRSHGRNRDYRAHMNVYGRKRLRASDRGTGIERHITLRIHQTPSRSFRSCEGAGDARRYM